MVQKSPAELLEHGTILRQFAPGIWSYPGAPMDPSGTNVKLPVDYTTEAEINEGIEDGTLVVSALGNDLSRSSVSLAANFSGRVHTPVTAGTVEASTQLPPGSQPTHDAGSVPMTAAQAEQGAIHAMEESGLLKQPVLHPTEGAETKGRTSDEGAAFSKDERSKPDGRKHR